MSTAPSPNDPTALARVHTLHQHIVTFLRTLSDACLDDHVSVLEGVGIGKAGLEFVQAVLALFRETDAATRREMLRLLEAQTFQPHGDAPNPQ